MSSSGMIRWQLVSPGNMPKALVSYPDSHAYLPPRAGVIGILPVRQDHQTLHDADIGCAGYECSIEDCLGVGKQASVKVFPEEPGRCRED